MPVNNQYYKKKKKSCLFVPKQETTITNDMTQKDMHENAVSFPIWTESTLTHVLKRL